MQPRYPSNGQKRTQGAQNGRSTSQSNSNYEHLQNSNSRSKKSGNQISSNVSYAGGTNTSRTNVSSNALQSSQGASNTNQNFKVVVRLRPPLPREKQGGNFFFPVMQVHPDNRAISVMEYFGREVDDRERARDVEMNPHLSMWHTYSFDHVYDMDST
jgi:hypothetical protein